MSDVVIRVENLGKKYRIQHQQRERYTALRDVIAQRAKALFRNLQSPISNLQSEEDFWALKDVSFEIKQGEVVGIIGRNGAGKSTLLKILSRITEPTTGRVGIKGRIASLLEVGTGFHPELTGRENIYLNGAILGMSRVEVARKFDEIVDFAEIEKFLDTPVKRYSSGMYMRLAFAVAAHLEPEILVVDEVLAVGDAEFQKKCLGKMQDVSKSGRTILFVSHNMNAIEDLCESVMLLNRGRLIRKVFDVRSAVSNYLFGEKEARQTSKWDNIDHSYYNPWFFPQRMVLVNKDGLHLAGPQRNDSDIYIQLEANIELLDHALTVGYCIYNEDGHQLYWCYQTDSHPDDWPKLTTGRVVIRSQLPRSLLNEGSYRIELIGGLSYRQWLFQPGESAPSVYLAIQGGLSQSPLWVERRPGILAPILNWTVVS